LALKKSGFLALLAAISCQLCAGILYMWGVFQPYVVKYYGWNPAQVAMTSAFMIAIFVTGTILSGLVQEKIHPRVVATTGAVLFCLGFYLTSILSSEHYWLIYITYSGFSGLGCGLVFSTVLSVVQKWYAARVGLATGLCVGSFGLATVIFTPIAESLLSTGGVPYAFRTLSIIFFVITMIACFFIKNPSKEYYYAELTKVVPPEHIKQFRPGQMLKSPSYYYILIALFTSSASYYIIIPFIKTIAMARGMSTIMALAAIMFSGVANASGRLFAPSVSDKIGRTTTIIACTLISASATILMIYATGLWYIAAVFFIAFSYGGISGVNPVISTELFGARYSGANYGLVMVGIAASSIIFSKLSLIINANGIETGDFTSSLILASILCAVPIIMMLLLKRRVKSFGKNI
jgi:OFA family oxalate/formate antiporter-like MFS transporter